MLTLTFLAPLCAFWKLSVKFAQHFDELLDAATCNILVCLVRLALQTCVMHATQSLHSCGLQNQLPRPMHVIS